MSDRPAAESACPCGSGLAFADCCEPALNGVPAPTAERLMRSRYTAFVLSEERYLSESWHPSTRPARIDTANAPRWSGLEIRRTEAGRENDDRGIVEFIAHHHAGALHETSRFVREDGRWYYLDGEIHPKTGQPSRNGPCPCGSGRKYKRCCGRDR